MTIKEQNVVELELATEEENVDTSKLRIREPGVDETSTQCNLELALVIVSNLSDDICPKTNWEFRPKNGRLDYFKIYID